MHRTQVGISSSLLTLPNLEESRQTGPHYAHEAIYVLLPHLGAMFLGMG